MFEPPADVVYTIEATARLVGIPRRTILRYCRRGLISAAADAAKEGYFFDRGQIRTLRQIETLRPVCRDHLASIKLIIDLLNEIQHLRSGADSRSVIRLGDTARRSRKAKREHRK